MKKKTVLLGVSGGIAAYKIPNLASMLVKEGYDVHVILTKNGAEFIPPLPFEALTGNRCYTDTFERTQPPEIHHIELARKADLILVAPASADVIGKIANGIADDMLTSTVLPARCPLLFAPAMNTYMFENPVVQDNIEKMKGYGWKEILPATGHLACGTTGTGKMPEPAELFDYIQQELECEKDLSGLKVLVTAGPTREAIDPVRFITNHSSGKMGYAMARAAARRGADVTLVSGECGLEPPRFVKTVKVVSAGEMFDAVTALAPQADVVIKAAAVADYTPANPSDQKVKKKDGDLSIPLVRTRDILGYLGEHKRDGQFLCGFSMETENMLENSREKLARKKLDLIVANNVKTPGAGFKGDTNLVTLITKEEELELPLMSKEETAHKILDAIQALMADRAFKIHKGWRKD